MRVGILGTGTMATALGQAWAGAGHSILIGGRSAERAATVAERIGRSAHAVPPSELPGGSDVVVVAVAWEGLEEALSQADATNGSLVGVPVVDCTNAVDYSTGQLKVREGSAAEEVARLAVGAHVVKALHLFAGQSWLEPAGSGAEPVRTVAICGDDEHAVNLTGTLIRDLGGQPALLGGLDRSRQLEEVAGFVIRLVTSGFDPATAIPAVPMKTSAEVENAHG